MARFQYTTQLKQCEYTHAVTGLIELAVLKRLMASEAQHGV